MTEDHCTMLSARLSHPEMQLAGGLGMPAGGGPKPVLDFDFTTISTLDSRISFSRASSATRVNANGHIETVAANRPRFNHDPVTLRPLGLLVEDQRTNMLLHSGQFTTSSWTKTRSAVIVTSAVSPAGTSDAAKIVEDGTAADSHLISQSVTLSAGAYTRSVYLKPAGRQWARLGCGGLAAAYFDLSAGTVGSVSGTGSPSATIQAAGNGWYRASLSFTATAGTVSVSTGCALGNGSDLYSGDGSSGLLLWGDQLEAGGFATSYIPTAGATVTRAMDLPTILLANLGQMWNPAGGTFLVCCDFPKYIDAEPICIDDESSANAIEIYRKNQTQISAFIIKESLIQVDAFIVQPTSSKNSYCLSFKNDDVIFSDQHFNYAEDRFCEMPLNLKVIRIGHYRGFAKSINGHMSLIRYYNKYSNWEEVRSYLKTF